MGRASGRESGGTTNSLSLLSRGFAGLAPPALSLPLGEATPPIGDCPLSGNQPIGGRQAGCAGSEAVPHSVGESVAVNELASPVSQ